MHVSNRKANVVQEENEQSENENVERVVVLYSYSIVNPWAVMVVVLHSLVAEPAVLYFTGDGYFTNRAYFIQAAAF